LSAKSPILSIRNLSVAYDGVDGFLEVVSDVSLDLVGGEALGLVGESGSGKSTLALQCLGYQHPRARVLQGKVFLQGKDLLNLGFEDLSRIRGKTVSFVPQNPTTALNPAKRIGQLFTELLLHHGVVRSNHVAAKRTTDLLSQVGLPDPNQMIRRYPHELSGGQQQRVCIALALACSPDLVVLDEPTTGLDVTTQEQIIGLLVRLRQQLGLSMLYVTHDLALLSQIADRVAVMYAGQIIEVAPTVKLFKEPLHPYTRGLIASVPHFLSANSKIGARPLQGLLRRADLPDGCRFSTRCEHVTDLCMDTRQRLEATSTDHYVACHRWNHIKVTFNEEKKSERVIRQKAEAILKIEELTVTYHRSGSSIINYFRTPTTPAVHNVSFQIRRGGIFALVGESGSGKSTIAKSISGIQPLDGGKIIFQGSLITASIGARPKNLRKEIQYVFQNPDASLNPRIKISEIIGRQIEILNDCGRDEIGERVMIALDDVRLDRSYAKRYPDELSGGERQRVAIARALIVNPSLLLCDEILSGLDVSVQANVLDLLRRLVLKKDVSMLFISHDIAVVRGLADDVGVLYDGCLVEMGTNEEIFSAPFHPYTEMLMKAVPKLNKKPLFDNDSHQITPSEAKKVGCAFCGRCSKKIGEICEVTPPPWRLFGQSLYIRCHHEGEELKMVPDQK